MPETVLYIRHKGESEWREHSTHPNETSARSTGKQLLTTTPTIEKIRVAGDVYAVGPHGAVMEVMED